MLSSILSSSSQSVTIAQILICSATSIMLGIVIALTHMYRNVYTKSFIVTLAVLPLLVQSVIMLVNGNLGTGMAVLGAFSLIRFRSVAGGAREITSIFWAMGVGLATGMGYISYIAIFSVMTGLFFILLHSFSFGEGQKRAERTLKIVIPEDLDEPELFDDLLKKYTHRFSLEAVKTTNMGSLYELNYYILLKDVKDERTLMDQVRARNGNLSVISAKNATNKDVL